MHIDEVACLANALSYIFYYRTGKLSDDRTGFALINLHAYICFGHKMMILKKEVNAREVWQLRDPPPLDVTVTVDSNCVLADLPWERADGAVWKCRCVKT